MYKLKNCDKDWIKWEIKITIWDGKYITREEHTIWTSMVFPSSKEDKWAMNNYYRWSNKWAMYQKG